VVRFCTPCVRADLSDTAGTNGDVLVADLLQLQKRIPARNTVK